MSNTSSPYQSAQNGVVGAYDGGSDNILRAMMAFSAIAWYNATELLVLILLTFKKYRGLYFWSLTITTISIIPYTLGAWGRLVGIFPSYISGEIVGSISWLFMVNGESLVLYSRLHLVTQERRLLWFVLGMIIVDAVCLCIPTIIFAWGSQLQKPQLFVSGYAVIEKVQMTVFSAQELLISGIYIWEVRRILKVIHDGGTRRLMFQLIAINLAIMVLDVALLSVEYIDLYQIEVTLKGMVYSMKLKMEFAVLSKLVKVVTGEDEGMHRVTTAGSVSMPAGMARMTATSVPTTITSSSSKDKEAESGHEWVEFARESSSSWRNEAIEFDTMSAQSRRPRKLSDEILYPGRLT